MMLPSAVPAIVGRVRERDGVLAAPLFAGSYLGTWAVAALAMWLLYRPPGAVTAGALIVGAGLYELTPLKRECRRRCRERVRSGLRFGVYCFGSSIGLMLVLVAVDVMSIPLMSRCASSFSPRSCSHPIPPSTCRWRWRSSRSASPPPQPETTRRHDMTTHTTASREQWLAARLELLEAEKELTRRSDEVARQRQQLPWVRVEKDYRFETEDGRRVAGRPVRRALAAARLPLHVRTRVHGRLPVVLGDRRWLQRLRRPPRAPRRRDLVAVSRAPIAALQAYKRRMGWTFPWASSLDSDFNFDFNTSFTEEQQARGHRLQLRAPGHDMAARGGEQRRCRRTPR